MTTQDTFSRNLIRAHVAPTGTTDPPLVYFSGSDKSIPIIHLSDEADPYAALVSVEIALGNHDQPVDYLRAFAARLLTAASEIEAGVVEVHTFQCEDCGWIAEGPDVDIWLAEVEEHELAHRDEVAR